MRFIRLMITVVASGLLVLGLGCRGTEPVVANTLDYEATQWLITGAIDEDALAVGAMLDLVMREGGIVDGMLFMPASITTRGNDFTARLAGSWIKRGDTIRFNEVSLTFVSDFDWILTPENLSAADSVDGSFYDIILTRMF